MNKNTRILISTIALISVLLVGKEIVNSNDESKRQIEYLETKIDSLENELQTQNQPIQETLDKEEISTPTNESSVETEENNRKQENFYDINNLKIIEKTYKDGNTKKSLVISSTSYIEDSNEFSDIKELSNSKCTKVRTDFYSLFKGEWLGYQETVEIDSKNINGTYSKIEYDEYSITKRIINNPDFFNYNYEKYSDSVEIKVFSLEDVLDASLIKAKYTLSDLLEIIIELDGKVETKIEDIIVNKLIR